MSLEDQSEDIDDITIEFPEDIDAITIEFLQDLDGEAEFIEEIKQLSEVGIFLNINIQCNKSYVPFRHVLLGIPGIPNYTRGMRKTERDTENGHLFIRSMHEIKQQ